MKALSLNTFIIAIILHFIATGNTLIKKLVNKN